MFSTGNFNWAASKRGSVPTEKANGSAIYDKGKRTKGEPPFMKQEREEMEALLDGLGGKNNFLFSIDSLVSMPMCDQTLFTAHDISYVCCR